MLCPKSVYVAMTVFFISWKKKRIRNPLFLYVGVDFLVSNDAQ